MAERERLTPLDAGYVKPKADPHVTVDFLRGLAPGLVKRFEEAEAKTGYGGLTEGMVRAITPETPAEIPLMALGPLGKTFGKAGVKAAGAAAAGLAGMSEAEAGPLSFLLRGGKTAAREAAKVGPGVNIQGFHWSHEPNLQSTLPAMYGKGIKGEEAARLALNPDIKPRSYYYTDELRKEPGLGAYQYTGTLPNMYPSGDPENLMKAARAKNPMDPHSEFERMVKAKGYKGYENMMDKAAVVFEPVSVMKHKQGTAPQPPKAPKAMITDTTETMPGTKTGIKTTPEHEAERMKWLEQDKTFEGLGLKPEVSTETGYYTNPQGVVERNPVRTTSVEYSPENVRVMDLVSAMRNTQLGQNARAYGGVSPEGGGGLRIAMSGQTPEQQGRVMEALNVEGGYAAPGGEGIINFGRFSGSDPEAQEMAYEALKGAGVPHARAEAGGLAGDYQEIPWGEVGSGQVTREHLMPLLLRDPELVSRIDRTGGPQQLARGLMGAERRAQMRNYDKLPLGREDITKMNDIIAKGGYGGLRDYVKQFGPAGLPAVGGMAALLRGPDEER